MQFNSKYICMSTFIGKKSKNGWISDFASKNVFPVEVFLFCYYSLYSHIANLCHYCPPLKYLLLPPLPFQSQVPSLNYWLHIVLFPLPFRHLPIWMIYNSSLVENKFIILLFLNITSVSFNYAGTVIFFNLLKTFQVFYSSYPFQPQAISLPCLPFQANHDPMVIT